MRAALKDSKHIVIWPLLGAILMAALFLLWPELDIYAARLFYIDTPDLSQRFAPGEKGIWKLLYEIVPYIARALIAAILILYLLGKIKKRVLLGMDGKAVAFLLLAFALGPGLVVHTLFKDQWGRPRPHHIQTFGGDKPFVPAWVMSDACDKNCSFVSGHAATGFFLMSLGFIATRRRKTLLLIGIGMGLATGLARMAQGGHFLSDILFAGIIVYFVTLATYVALYRRLPTFST